MNNLKIGILGTRGIPNHYGGFEQFAEHLSLGLTDRGHEVYVYNSSLHPYVASEWNGVRIVHCRDREDRIGTAGQFIYDWNCINDARRRNFDVLLHLGYTSDSIWHWRWPRQSVNIVNMDGLEWQRSKYNKPTQGFLRWAESLAAKHADIMIADSRGIQDHLLKTYGKNAIYIPYGAAPFDRPVPAVPGKYGLTPFNYALLIARMEPENNIEMVIRGHIAADTRVPLFIVGNITNIYGRYLTQTFNHPSIRFSDAIYDQFELDNLRYHSVMYFHGHSVGGTNPSLLEAMACGCHIAAHDNQFNRAILQEEAMYFRNSEEVANLIGLPVKPQIKVDWRKVNLEKIRNVYDREKIVDAYERVMLEACGLPKIILQPVAAKAV